MTVKIIFVNLKFQMEQVLEAIILGVGESWNWTTPQSTF
jgi:hypothetical protein